MHLSQEGMVYYNLDKPKLALMLMPASASQKIPDVSLSIETLGGLVVMGVT